MGKVTFNGSHQSPFEPIHKETLCSPPKLYLFSLGLYSISLLHLLYGSKRLIVDRERLAPWRAL